MTPDALLAQYGPRESMEYDVVVVGAGPGGLATAIRLKQLATEAGRDVSVCVLAVSYTHLTLPTIYSV